jgi:hypothetical protein
MRIASTPRFSKYPRAFSLIASCSLEKRAAASSAAY